jgi:hypothetical protein
VKVYIAGPMTGIEFYNFPRFFDAKMDWITAGHEAITPFDTNSAVWARHYGRPFDPYSDKCDYGDPILAEMWLENMGALTRADAIALLPGWEKSRGATAELVVALGLGKEVYEAFTMERLYLRPVISFQVEIPDAKKEAAA